MEEIHLEAALSEVDRAKGRGGGGAGPGRIGSGTLEDDPKRTKQLTARDGA